jgi:DNA-binding CsgD family transcriptional regulator
MLVEAELHVDALIAADSEFHDQADPTARELLATLTADERTVLETLARGHSLRASADRLGLSARETQAIRKDLFAKIGAESASEALRISRYGGWRNSAPLWTKPLKRQAASASARRRSARIRIHPHSRAGVASPPSSSSSTAVPTIWLSHGRSPRPTRGARYGGRSWP